MKSLNEPSSSSLSKKRGMDCIKHNCNCNIKKSCRSCMCDRTYMIYNSFYVPCHVCPLSGVGPQTAMDFIGVTFQYSHSWWLPSRDVLMCRSHAELKSHTIDWYFLQLIIQFRQAAPELFRSSGSRPIYIVKKPVVGRLPAGSGPVARSSGAPDDRPYLSLPHVKIRIGSSVLVWTFIRCSSEFGYRHFCARVDYRHVSDLWRLHYGGL